jgi:hypothetical protein
MRSRTPALAVRLTGRSDSIVTRLLASIESSLQFGSAAAASSRDSPQRRNAGAHNGEIHSS